MNDQILEQLAQRLQIDFLILKRIGQQMGGFQNQADAIRAVNDVKAIQAQSGGDIGKAADMYVQQHQQEQQTQNPTQQQPTSQTTPQQPQEAQASPQPQPGTPPQSQLPAPASDGSGADFYKKYQQGYQFKSTDGSSDLGGQCAWFAEQVTQLPDGQNWTIGSTLQDKQNQLAQHVQQGNAFFKGQDTPKVGESIVFGGGKYGHVAVVSEVLPNGKLRLTEANYNNDLKVRHDRIVDQNDPNILGFVKTQPKQEFQIKPADELRKELAQQGVKTNETTPPEPQIPQDVDPNNPQDQEKANKQLKQVNTDLEKQRETATQAPSTTKGTEQTATESNNSINSEAQQRILDTLPANQREAAAKALPGIASALKNEGILTPKVLGYALATAGHESGFVPKEEIMASRGINPRNDYVAGLQENYSGGQNYRGRGYIQLTHDYNYKKFGDRIGENLVQNPEKLLDPKVSAKVLAAYFKDNGIADAVEGGDYTGARVKIQGRGATNAQFMGNTQAIAKQAQALEGAIGTNAEDIAKSTDDPNPDNTSNIGVQTDQEKLTKGVEQKGVFEQAQTQANKFSGKGEQNAGGKGMGFLAPFSAAARQNPWQDNKSTTGAEGAINSTQQNNKLNSGDNTNVFKTYAKDIGVSTGNITDPADQQDFQDRMQSGDVLFTPARDQSQEQQDDEKSQYTDPFSKIKNAISEGASNVASQSAQAVQRAVGNAIPKVQASTGTPSVSKSGGQSFNQVRQAQTNRAFSSAAPARPAPAPVSRAPAASVSRAVNQSRPAVSASRAPVSRAVSVSRSPAPVSRSPVASYQPSRPAPAPVSRAPVASVSRAVSVSRPSNNNVSRAVSAAKTVAQAISRLFRR
jgi:predicted chitinase/surface antigen